MPDNKLNINNRIAWVDVLKCLGMLAIFEVHLGSGNHIHDFVIAYNVPLFFFISGLLALDINKYTYLEMINKHFKNIIIPYIFLCAINMFVIFLGEDLDFWTTIKWTKQLVFGIRNQVPIAALWFFSCLFIVSIIFDAINKLLKNKYIVFATCVMLYVISMTLFPNRPDIKPTLIFNIDSAFVYILYYGLGFILKGLLLAGRNFNSKIRCMHIMAFLFLGIYAFLVYTEKDIVGDLAYGFMPHLADYVYEPLRTFLLILFNVCIAKLLADCKFMAYAGSKSLWLCGNEAIVKRTFEALAGLVGTNICISNDYWRLLYGIVMLIVIIKVIYPIEDYLYQKYIGLGKLLCQSKE